MHQEIIDTGQFSIHPAIAGLCVLLLFATGWAFGSTDQDAEFFAQSGSRYAEIIQRSERAFMQRDTEGAIQDMAEDYVLYDIKDDGPVERLRGKETVRKILPMILTSDKWLGSDVDRLALLDNTLVQVEHDRYKEEDGSERVVSTLVVFEHRDGKRWREWRFIPADR